MIPFDQFKESSIYQFIVEEGLEEGHKKGLKEGLEEGLKEGMKEGRAQGVAETLSKLILKRFPNLSVAAEIEGINDVNVLQDLCLEVEDFQDAEALRTRLVEVTKSTS